MKILFMPHAVTIQHVIRPFLVAKELKQRGHEVFFGLTNSKYEYLLQNEEMPVFRLSGIDTEKAIRIVRSYRYNIEDIVRQLSDDLNSDTALIEKVKPDVIVNDMRFTVKTACWLKNIPYVLIVNSYYTGRLASRHLIPERIFLSRVLPRFLQKAMFGFTFKAMDYALGTAMRRLSKLRGIPGIHNVTQSILSPELTLITDIPEFFPCKNLTPAFHYVGPFLWEPDISLPEWFFNLDKTRPIIYLTLGTSGSLQYIPEMLQALSQQDYQVVFSTGGEKYKGALPSGIYMADFLPALKILDKANLVICHGGNGTIYQALSRGVPVIGLPTFYDQEWNSERLEDLKIGKRLSLRTFTKDKLIKAVEELINNQEVKNNCLKFKELIPRYDAPKKSADLIEAIRK